MAKTFTYAGGNDTITNYNGGDLIKISAKKISSYSFDGNDLILKIGSGTLTLTDMKGRAITVKNSSGKTTTKIYGTGYTAQDVIKNLVAAWNKTQLTGTAKLDESIKLCSPFKGIQDVINHMVADCRAAGNADTFLRKYCGIILDNEDTGAITGWDAGGLTVKTAKDIIPETTTVKKLDDYTNASFVRDEVTINISSTGDSLTADGKKVLDGLYNWWAEGALKLIEESYGIEFHTGNEINIALTPSASYWGQTTGDSVKINLGDTRFNGDDDYQGNGVDRTIAHEFTHFAQNFFMGTFPRFLGEGLADLTCGRDDKKTATIKKLAGNADTLKKYLDINKGGTGNSNYYAAGFMFYRYLAKQAADAYDSSSSYAWTDNIFINGTSKADFLTGSGRNSTIDGSTGNDTLTAYGDGMQVFGGDGKDFILTNGNAIKVSGGAGRDKIKNRGDNSRLEGDASNDFIINGGYWENEHGGANVSISGGTGNDTITSHGSKSVIDGGKNNDLIYNGYRYYEPWNYFYNANDDDFKGNGSTIIGGTGNDTINNLGDYVLIETGTGKNSVDNGSSTCVGGSNLTIIGGTSNDSITNYGGSFVTINAGAGDDFISNIYAVDYRDYSQETKKYETVETISPKHILFQYRAGDGNDLIEGFNKTSTLQIGDGSATYSKDTVGDDVIINVGEGKITLQGASSLSAVNIKGKESSVWRLNDTVATYGTSKKASITVSGVKSLSGLSLKNKIVTLKKSALSNKASISGNGYEFNFASDYKQATITGSKGADLLTTRGNNLSIYGGAGNDTINVLSSATTVSGGTGNDLITGDGNNLSIHGGDGNDTINVLSSATTVSGGTGNDLITGDGNNLSIHGGAGNDSINVLGSATTVRGGTGDDLITSSGKGNLFVYASGDGNDVIADFSESDKIKITKGTATVTAEGNDILVNVGSGSIKLTGATGQNISIINSKGKEKNYWFTNDDSDFSTNKLASIVYNSSGDYPLGTLDTSTPLTNNKTLITYMGKK